METVKIVFMRHGRSRADDEGVHEGWYDSPLTDVGRSQIRARAEEFKARDFRFDAVVTSPFLRALESARMVGERLHVSVETETDWAEINNGPLAGMSYARAEKEYPRPSFRNPYEAFWGTGEGDWEAYRRASRAVEKIIRRGPGSYLVVSHGGILNHALRTIAGIQPPINWQGLIFAFGDAGFVRMEYRPDEHKWLLWELKAG